MAPSPDSLCCASSSYYRSSSWQSCSAANDPTVGEITSCTDCFAYQCIDWTVGSRAMRTREANFYNETGQMVYFAVGSFGNDPSIGGQCYRISTDSIDRDIIMQVIDVDNSGGDSETIASSKLGPLTSPRI